MLFAQGIKVLSLFIDEVAKYRDYSQADEAGEYARILRKNTGRSRLNISVNCRFDGGAYRDYLNNISVDRA